MRMRTLALNEREEAYGDQVTIELRATGYGLRATGYGARMMWHERLAVAR